MSCPTWKISADNLCELEGLQNAVTGAYQNAATVKVTMTDIDDEDAVVVDDQTMVYVAASNGDYRYTIDKAIFTASMLNHRIRRVVTSVEGGVDGRFVDIGTVVE